MREIGLVEIRENLPQEDQEFLQYWFPSQSQEELFALAAAIEEEPNRVERELAWVVFSSLIIAKSTGASSALDLARTRPHKRRDKPIVLPFDAWDRRFKSVTARLPFLDSRLDLESTVQIEDARSLPLEDCTVDLVLTSPPYLNAVDYLRAHKFSLVWMGYRLEELRELRGTMVGTERGLWSLDSLPPSLERRLEQVVGESRRRAQVRRYLSDLRKVLMEIHRVLLPGGLAYFVVGPAIIHPKRSDAVEVIEQVSGSVGLRLVGSVARSLNPARRSLPPPSVAKQTPLAKRMRREFILALSK